eukprot:403344343
MMNKHLKRLLKQSEEDIRHLNISDLMPNQIAKHHQKFMINYQTTGISKMLNNKMTVFIKDSNHHLMPVNILTQLHYSYQYGYCFVTLIDLIENFKPFQDNKQYKSDSIIYMSFDCENAQILETSENFDSFLRKADALNQDEQVSIQFRDKVITLFDIFADFKISNDIMDEEGGLSNKYEGIHKIDFSIFNDHLSNETNLKLQKNKPIQVKIKVLIEEFGMDQVKVGYVIFSILQRNSESNKNIMPSIEENHLFHIYESEDLIISEVNNLEDQQFDDFIDNEGQSSQAGSSQSSQDATYGFDIKKFHLFYKQKTPRILKLVIQLIYFLCLGSFVISTVNLCLSIENSSSTSFDVRTVKTAFDRINYTINNRLILRVLLNIANGYEPNFSKLIPDRFQTYKDMQKIRLQSLKDTNQILDIADYKFGQEVADLSDSQVLKLTYLSNQNSLFYENTTMKIAHTLYNSKLTEINNFNMTQFKGNLQVHSLKPNLSSVYKPSIEEQMLHFSVINSNGVIREYNWVFMNQYLLKTVSKANDRLEQALILTIISILTIVTVTIVVSPIISKTEERKFSALIFFIKLPLEKIQFFQKRCESCLQLEDDSNQQIKLKSKGFEILKKIEDVSISHYNKDSISNNQSINEKNSIYESSGRIEMSNISVNNFLKIQTKRSSQNSLTQGSFQHFQFAYNPVKKPIFKTQKQTIEVNVEDVYDSIQNDSSIIDKNIMNQSVNNLVQSATQSKSSYHMQHMQHIELSDLSHHHQTKNKLNEQQISKIYQIKRVAKKQKIRSFFLIFFLALVFSMYFVATLIMQKNSYSHIEGSVNDLSLVFNKEVCFENLLIFIRENAIQNTSIKFTELPNAIASKALLNTCQLRETAYNIMKKNLPVYFSGAKEVMDKIDSRYFCDYFYQQGTVQFNFQDKCKTTLNGILNKGITNANAFFYQQAQMIQIQFDDAKQMKTRNEAFLKLMLNDTGTLEIIDSKAILLSYAFTQLKDACVQSVVNYFELQRDQLIIIYVIFITILVIALLYFQLHLLRKIRLIMWNTNLMLKIIPQECLMKEDKGLLKSFIVS